MNQAKRFKELKRENSRLRRLVEALTIDNSILKETHGKLLSPTEFVVGCGPGKEAPGSGRGTRKIGILGASRVWYSSGHG
jgi:hypothetical protein